MTGYAGHKPIDRLTLAPWAVVAACRGEDLERWYPQVTLGRTRRPRQGDPYAAGRAICATCPVQAACLAHAQAEDETHGLWGGLDPDQRSRLAKRQLANEPELHSVGRP